MEFTDCSGGACQSGAEHTTINSQFSTGDHARGFGVGQEQNRFRHFFRLTVVGRQGVEVLRGSHCIGAGIQSGLEHGCHKRAGMQRVDADTIRGKVKGRMLGQMANGTLGCLIGGVVASGISMS